MVQPAVNRRCVKVAGWAILGWAIAASLAAQVQGEPIRFADSRQHMGADFQVVAYAADQGAAKQALAAAHQRAEELDAMLSDYRLDSELNRLSRAALDLGAIQVSSDLYEILTRAQQISEASAGAFDVTVGPVVRLWRRARRRGRFPDADRLATARAAVGYQLLTVVPAEQAISLTGSNMRLDLGGIAKGYAAQAMLETLQQHGIQRALVNAGGDIAVSQPPPDSEGWKIGVMPLGESADALEAIQVSNACVATSGDAWQFVEIEGQRFSHIVDPRTGIGSTRRGGVTVIAADGATSDALASALSVLDPAAGIQLVRQFPGAAARMVWLDEGHRHEVRTENFPPLQPVPPSAP